MEREQLPTILAWTVCLGATTAAAAFATSRWWWRDARKGSSGSSGGKASRKALARSPGVRVVCVQDASAGSNGLLGGWGALTGGVTQDEKDRASKWEQSKQKGDLGYYFAHHTSMKELAPEDYRMNGPRLLSKGDAPGPIAAATNGAGSPSPASPPAARRRPQQISSYSWEDYGEEVRLTFRLSEWQWTKVDEEEILVEWGPRRFRLSIDSREYGLHTMDLPRLNGEVSDVRVLKLKSRLVVGLVKGGRGYAKKSPWDKLQAAPVQPSD